MCLECSRIRSREYYYKTPPSEHDRQRRLLSAAKRRENPVMAAKYRSRAKARNALVAGKIQRQPCIKCKSEKAQMHHPDYEKPLFIVWLCSRCHSELHLNQGDFRRPVEEDCRNCTQCQRFKRIKAKNLCVSCYDKMIVKVGECKECGRVIKLHTKSFCSGCYNRIYRRKKAASDELEAKKAKIREGM